jgi:hypothetical protein
MLSEQDVSAIKAMGPAMDSAALAGDWTGLTGMFAEDVAYARGRPASTSVS